MHIILELPSRRHRSCQTDRLWSRNWRTQPQTYRISQSKGTSSHKKQYNPTTLTPPSARQSEKQPDHPPLHPRAPVDLPLRPQRRPTLRRLHRRFPRLHGPRSPPRKTVHLFSRLLEPRLHLLRVPRWLPALQRRHARRDMD